MRGLVLGVLLAILFSSSTDPVAAQQPTCRFVLGFADLAARLGPDVVGQCSENQRTTTGPETVSINGTSPSTYSTGVTLQRTTRGLFIYLPDVNVTQFDTGIEVYSLGTAGLYHQTWAEILAPSRATLTPTSTVSRAIPAAPRFDEREYSLFDKSGAAAAYIAPDEESTIYLWMGKPVAYLARKFEDIHIYNFDGRHLGWLDRGVVVDHEGDAAGFLKGAVSLVTQIEPVKGIKEIKPIRSIQEIPPIRPIRSGYWSPVPLRVFLSA